MKRFISFFAAVVMLAVLVPNSYAYDFSYTYQGKTLYYNIQGGYAQVTYQSSSSTSYLNLSGSLTIPTSVTYNGTTYSVTSIGERAFRGCTDLNSVTIPNSITTIGNYAFSGSGLTSVTIPNSITTIGNYAFNNCRGMTSVTIPNSVTSISDNAFSDCTGLNSVYYTGDVAGWCGISFGTATSNPIVYGHNLYINNSLVTDLVIPNSVTTIGKYAFRNCDGLTSVTIPNSVTTIGEYAFYSCSGLTSVNIPNSVTTIGDRTFSYCTELTGALTIPNSVTSIGTYAFHSCTGLTSLTIGSDGVYHTPVQTAIGTQAFANCTGLTEIHCLKYDPPTLLASFRDVTATIPVYIPCGTSSLYTSSDWNYFFNFFEDDSSTFSAISSDNNMGTVQIITMPTCGDPSTAITATPNSGYRFTHWSDNSTENPYYFFVSGNVELIAYFEPIIYCIINVVYDNTEMGSVTGGGTFDYGTSITISAEAVAGHHFTHWNDGNTQNPRTVTVTSDATYTAYFESNTANEYTITVISQNPAMGSTTGSGTFEYGTVTTITAEPYNGYHFVQWQDGNTQRIRTITVTGNATYTAYFDGSNDIDDVETADNLKIYTRGNTIVIDFSGQQVANDRQSVVVYDVMGRVIKQSANSGQQAEVEIPVTSAGVYMVKVGDQPSRKVVVRP